jgi:CheY-like chemotaxis protein
MAAILLVEDVPLVSMTLVRFLERGGHGVTVCMGGDEAWSKASKTRFDVIVTDLWMMDGDGPGFIGRVRSSGDATPIIAITGGDPRSPQSTSIEVALSAGADRAVLKPITKATLLDAISEIMRTAQSATERTN